MPALKSRKELGDEPQSAREQRVGQPCSNESNCFLKWKEHIRYGGGAHLRYCSSVWSCVGSTEIHLLQKLQIRAARIMTNCSFNAPSTSLVEVLGWKAIDDLV